MWPRIGGLRTLALGTPGELRTTLNTLVLSGVKTATAGLLTDEYAAENEELEHVGERLVLVDDDDKLIGVVEVTGVEVVRFADVPWDFARAEGEGDRSIEEWREGHRRYWARVGFPVDDDSQVVCIRFRLASAGDGGISTGDLGT
ncbi:ASCH domain-containing protein [Micromonospora chersina]